MHSRGGVARRSEPTRSSGKTPENRREDASMARLKVLIAGGGIGGITAMLALRQRGIEVQLFEQAAAFRQVGAGLQVSSNAARILLKLGLGEALKRCIQANRDLLERLPLINSEHQQRPRPASAGRRPVQMVQP